MNHNSPIDWSSTPILESITTTIDTDGGVHAAPLGPRVLNHSNDPPTFQLRPYEGSNTCDNLLRSGNAVIHVTDDAAMIAGLILGDRPPLTRPVDGLEQTHHRLVRCHRWFAVQVTDRDAEGPLHHLTAETIDSGVVDPFFGFNRAKSALIELAILATRIDRIDPSEIRRQMNWLSPWVEKTALTIDRQAWDRLLAHVTERLR